MNMETLETLYAGMFNEHDNIEAARGCNQYKHVQGCDAAGGGDSAAIKEYIIDVEKHPTSEDLEDQEVTVVNYYEDNPDDPNGDKILDWQDAASIIDSSDDDSFVIRDGKLVWKGYTGEYVFKNPKLAERFQPKQKEEKKGKAANSIPPQKKEQPKPSPTPQKSKKGGSLSDIVEVLKEMEHSMNTRGAKRTAYDHDLTRRLSAALGYKLRK